MTQIKEVPGNTIATVAAVQKAMLQVANALYITEGRIEGLHEQGEIITGVRFRAPTQLGGEWLAVVSLLTTEGRFVGFHSDVSFVAAVRGVCNRINNGSMIWKDDQYAGK